MGPHSAATCPAYRTACSCSCARYEAKPFTFASLPFSENARAMSATSRSATRSLSCNAFMKRTPHLVATSCSCSVRLSYTETNAVGFSRHVVSVFGGATGLFLAATIDAGDSGSSFAALAPPPPPSASTSIGAGGSGGTHRNSKCKSLSRFNPRRARLTTSTTAAASSGSNRPAAAARPSGDGVYSAVFSFQDMNPLCASHASASFAPRAVTSWKSFNAFKSVH
eukprot:27760-Pelagococcus_subviridis.AAC.7